MNAPLDHPHWPLRDAHEIGFWRTLHPDLAISDRPLAHAASPLPALAAAVSRLTADTAREGYFHAPPLIATAQAARLAQVVDSLVQRGIPPVFCLVYDAFWQMFAGLDPLLRSLLGEEVRMMPTDIWAWHVGRQDGATGWGPHRDLPRADAVRANGLPRLLNVWVPLTDVSPDHACMYVLPAHLDPNFPQHIDGGDFSLRDWQNIRALPTRAGSALGWNTQVLHWGGRSSGRADVPRISVGIYFHSADCDLHEINPDVARQGFTSLPFGRGLQLPFAARLEAIAGAIYMYNRRIPGDFPNTWEAVFAFARQHRRAG